MASGLRLRRSRRGAAGRRCRRTRMCRPGSSPVASDPNAHTPADAAALFATRRGKVMGPTVVSLEEAGHVPRSSACAYMLCAAASPPAGTPHRDPPGAVGSLSVERNE